MILSKCSPLITVLKFHSACVVHSEFLVVVEKMNWVSEVNFVLKLNWVILFFKKGFPTSELEEDEG